LTGAFAKLLFGLTGKTSILFTSRTLESSAPPPSFPRFSHTLQQRPDKTERYASG
jgi:hypothetical protein